MSDNHLPRFARARLAELEAIADELRKRLRNRSEDDTARCVRELMEDARERQDGSQGSEESASARS